ncbi:MAG: hypothetical protein ACLRZ4_12145 [Eubacterium ramulus]|uniref:hypothetical protein n=1 Tax=Eubacterium ramulus TaxID=39490 RepID=UPI0039A1890E
MEKQLWNLRNQFIRSNNGISRDGIQKENNYRNETTFALSNGYIGTRGTRGGISI